MHSVMRPIVRFMKKEIVLVISLILAVVSMFFVTPSKDYLSYIDFRTLAILFCLMTIMAALQKLGIFNQLGELLVAKVSNVRAVSLILILLCFVLSMLITNDVALITFVPFTVIVLHLSDKSNYLIRVIVLETIAANLGSMLLPMGNPQNLYLYSLVGLGFLEFIALMLPYALVSLALIFISTFFFVKKESVPQIQKHEYTRNKREKIKLTVYFVLFVVSLLVVIRVLDYRIGFLLVLVIVLVMDTKIFIEVDYSLLFTFIFLFVFIGNLKQIPAVHQLLSSLVVGNEVTASVLSSQVISNVPAAILLSGFTTNIKALIVGTNLGGLGTLIASMASLISFKIYSASIEAKKGKYLLWFTLVNVGMLICLLVFHFVFHIL